MSKELQVCRPSGGPENHSRAPPVLGWPFGPGTLLSSAQMWVQSPPHSRGVLTVYLQCQEEHQPPTQCKFTVKMEEQKETQIMHWE